MNIKLKPIAESKVRQLGGDVCGVLVRKGDKVATVTDMGRVKWLSNSVLWPIANECKSEREAFEDAMAGEAHLKWIPEVGEYSSQITQKMWQTWRCARAGEDPDLQLIEQRDHWEEKATELAEAVGEHFGFQVGEHSSANCPVQNAIDQLDELGGVRAQGGQGAEVVAWCWENHGRHVTVDKSFAKELIADGEIVRPLVYGDTQPQPAVPEAKEIIDRVVAELQTGFVRCERCGDQEDTATLDCMTDLKRLKALLSTPTTPQADGCPECRSTDLTWHTQSSVTTGTPDGKLRANEVSTLFVLGCGHCSETIKTLTADQVAENMSLQPPVKGGE